MSIPRILVVDDEPQIHRFLTPALDAAGYEPARADTGAQALREIARRPPDAVVLDLGLPDMDGKAVLIQARTFYAGPIIILSARDRELEKIEALDNGANDYVEKPFGVGELLARLRVALRERGPRSQPLKTVQAGDLTIDFDKHLVTREGAPVRLSPKEFEVLTALAEGGGVGALLDPDEGGGVGEIREVPEGHGQRRSRGRGAGAGAHSEGAEQGQGDGGGRGASGTRGHVGSSPGRRGISINPTLKMGKMVRAGPRPGTRAPRRSRGLRVA